MNNNLKKISVYLSVALLYTGVGYLFYAVNCLKQTQQTVSEQNIKHLEAQISESRKIYVYSLEDVLRKINAVDEKVLMEEKILKLNNELMAAEKKIKSLKNAKVKEDISDMYVKNLRMKRDEIMENYEKTLGEITDKINSALNEIAREKNVSAIFVSNIIAVKTPYVEDVTDEIAAKILK